MSRNNCPTPPAPRERKSHSERADTTAAVHVVRELGGCARVSGVLAHGGVT
ncbi:hypothetical protein HMPREF0970_00741 [Schaalia odontolytica F0309]|uniref:Uncharacterized protein n=1 Tax=Schaalia odontolytica F0309 TaxID=649742 RepID=D4TXS2_9ACTO|nr:hypothetical protein HMPREF0970_00741 [Schaalia odontolytica F0309]